MALWLKLNLGSVTEGLGGCCYSQIHLRHRVQGFPSGNRPPSVFQLSSLNRWTFLIFGHCLSVSAHCFGLLSVGWKHHASDHISCHSVRDVWICCAASCKYTCSCRRRSYWGNSDNKCRLCSRLLNNTIKLVKVHKNDTHIMLWSGQQSHVKHMALAVQNSTAALFSPCGSQVKMLCFLCD